MPKPLSRQRLPPPASAPALRTNPAMKLTTQLVPIPPLGHPASTPDPPTLFHLTTARKLGRNPRSGDILSAAAVVPPRDRAVARSSTSSRK